jgi:hypothetical protein
VLAQPYPITSLAREAALLQDEIGGRCPEFAAVPIATLHMTVADLISRDGFAGLAWGEREEFCAKAARILAECRFPQDATGTVAGVGVFPSVVIALVGFTPAVYQALMTARGAVYAGLGLSRPGPFIGHITLGYVEIPAGRPRTSVCEPSRPCAPRARRMPGAPRAHPPRSPSTGLRYLPSRTCPGLTCGPRRREASRCGCLYAS